MSRELHLKDEIDAICRKAGLEVNTVKGMSITPEAVLFEVYVNPKQIGAADDALTVFVTHLWTREPE